MADFLTHTLGVSERIFYGNSLAEWLIAGAVAAAVWTGLTVTRRLIASRYRKYSTAHHSTPVRLIFHLLGHTKQFLFLAIAIDTAQESLSFPPKLQHIISNSVLTLILLQVGLWAGRSIRFYLELKELERGADRVFAGSLDIINFVARILIWSLLILVALDNFGVNITALLAGLGVGGVAVALALQNVLGDLFASLSIALDKPFVVGDTLNIDTFTGSVEHIGIKTTRLRSENGEQIILSNADILKSRVRNYGRMAEQRVLMSLRIGYGTPLDTLRGIPKLLEEIVRSQPNARFDRCHLKTLGESSLLFELAYFTQQPKLNPLLDLQHVVNFRILEEFSRLGVEFAYPTQRRLARTIASMIDVVLYEPEIPPNTGNVIRLCANTGATLHLVKPLGFRLDDKSLRRSGLDYHDIADVEVHDDVEACLDRLSGSRVFAVETGGRHRYGDLVVRAGDVFVFGPETRGLPAHVQDRIGRDRTLHIPMRAANRSLNLSNAVAIVVYEAWRQLGFSGCVGGPGP